MTTEPATITVAIPTFNRRTLLEQAVNSVLVETRVPIQVNVFDNASTDDTAVFMHDLAARDARVTYVRNETNIGGLRNIRSVAASVRTEYFVPLADDDLLLPDFLYDAYHIMQSRPSVGAAVFITEARTHDNRVGCVFPDYLGLVPPGEISPAAHMRLWLRHGHCAWSSVLWRTSVMAQTGHPYAGIGLPGDVDFQARVFAAFPAFLVNRPGAVYRVHDWQASLGFDITHIPDWAAIFNGLDRLMATLSQQEKTGIDPQDALPWDEYLTLRNEAWVRLRSLWNRPTAVTLSAAHRRRLALIAGFRLGDWQLAFSLADEGEGDPKPMTGASRLFSLPGSDIAGSGEFMEGDAPIVLNSVIRRFAESSAREREAATRLAEAQAAYARLEALRQEAETARDRSEHELAARRAREAILVGEVEALQQRCQRAEDRSLSRRTRRLVAHLTGLVTSRTGSTPS